MSGQGKPCRCLSTCFSLSVWAAALPSCIRSSKRRWQRQWDIHGDAPMECVGLASPVLSPWGPGLQPGHESGEKVSAIRTETEAARWTASCQYSLRSNAVCRLNKLRKPRSHPGSPLTPSGPSVWGSGILVIMAALITAPATANYSIHTI